MTSSEPLTRIAIESLRAAARTAAPPAGPVAATPSERLALLNALLLRDEHVLTRRPPDRRLIARGRTRL